MTKMAETMEMAILYKEQGLTLRQIGTIFGISKQTISRRFSKLKITRPGRRSPAAPPPCARIDKDRLDALYTKQRLSIEAIGRILNAGLIRVKPALRYYDIPKRRFIRLDGKHIAVIRELKVAEPRVMNVSVKHPYITLHKAAKRVGIKITVRKIGRETFTVSKIG